MPRKDNPVRVEELLNYFHLAYGIEANWPDKFEVSPLLYARVCEATFKYLLDKEAVMHLKDNVRVVSIALGPNGGIWFKNVELVMK